jgi:acetyl esterase/lipase
MSILDKLFGGGEPSRDHPAKPDIPMQKVLDVFQDDLGVTPYEQLTPQAARLQPTPADAVKKILADTIDNDDPTLGVKTREISIPGAAGPIQARIYDAKLERDDLAPVVVYWHGGGWVIADLDVYDGAPRGIARFADCIVVSCHYRQAPEDKFPAAHDDAFVAYRWVLEHAQEFGGDPRRVAVMGESAGGNLALATTIRARDEGQPLPAHMALIYPVAGADMTTPSYVENADAKPLGKPLMEWFVRHVFDSPDQVRDPRIDLVNADLRGLPDATIINAEIDPLRSEGELLAERLERAGSEVDQKTFHGATHEFFGMALVVPDAAVAQQMVAHNLKKAFGTAILPI